MTPDESSTAPTRRVAPALSPDDADRIRLEEIYRDEVRRSLRAPQTRWSRIYGFLNTSLGLFCLSSIVLAGLAAGFGRYLEVRRQRAANQELIRRLDAEISFRIGEIARLRPEIFPFEDLHTARAATRGRTKSDPEVGELGSFDPIFSEFAGRSLFALIWELQRVIPRDTRPELADSLNAAKELADLIDEDRLVLVTPRGDNSSTWTMSRADRARYLKNLSALDIERWK